MKTHFSDYFWGEDDKGFEVLLTRLRQGRTSVVFFRSIAITKANLELNHGKQLLKMGTTQTPEELPYI